MGERIELGLPDKLRLFDHGTYIEIVRKWFGWKIVFITAFAIFWDGFLFMWYSKLDENTELMAFLFPLLHVGVGIGITYYAVAGWFNRTHIYVSGAKIAVRHRPIPWLGNKELDALNLKQLYTKEKVSDSNNGSSVSYDIHAITHSGENIKLVSGLETSEQALYIEQEIEKYLRIEDATVKGEFGSKYG